MEDIPAGVWPYVHMLGDFSFGRAVPCDPICHHDTAYVWDGGVSC